MSQTIDQRIVEMQFDNSKFESNVNTSLGTLKNLKQSLNFDGAVKSFENLDKSANSVSFDALLSSVKSLEERFSTFGIIGMRVIENLTDSMMNLASKTISFLTDGIVSGGISRAMKLENAHFQLQGLLSDEEAVQAVMQNVNDAVDGTAYGLDAAATVAAQLVASGMEAGDKMYTSLRAVAGVAAMTNSEYSDIGNIFTTVAGNGRLMGEQLLQLSSRGLNAAATLASYLGTTETEVREMVSNGKIDFQTFADAMDDAFGEHAKAANETFTGALSNIKSALARIGALFVSPMIEQNGVLVGLFNTLREKINEVKTNVVPLADSFVELASSVITSIDSCISGIDLTKPFEAFYNIIEAIKNVFIAIGTLVKPVAQAFSEVFPAPTIDSAVSFTETLVKLSETLVKVSERLASFEAFYNIAKSIQNVFNGLWSIIRPIAQAFSEIFSGPTLDSAASFTEGLVGLTGNLVKFTERLTLSEESSAKLKDTFVGIFSAIDIGISFIKELITGVGNLLSNFKGLNINVLGVTSAIGNFISNIRTAVNETGIFKLIVTGVTSVMQSVITKINEVIDSLKNLFSSSRISGFASVLTGLWNVIQKIFAGIGEALNSIGNSSFANIISGGILTALVYNLKNFMYSLRNVLGFGLEIFGNKDVTGLYTGVVTCLDNLRSTLTSYQNTLKAESLLKLAAAIGILAASMLVLSTLDVESLSSSIAAIGLLFSELVGAMAMLTKFTRFSSSDGFMGALSGFIDSLGASRQFSALIEIAAAIGVLSLALVELSKIDADKLASSLSAITVLFADLTISMMALNKFGGQTSGLGGMIAFSVAIEVLALSCKTLSTMNLQELAQSVGGVAALSGIMVATFKILSSEKETFVVGGASMIAFSAAIEVLALACKTLSSLGLEGLIESLGSVVVLAGVMVASFKLLSSEKETFVVGGASMIAFSVAIEVLALACKTLSSIGLEGLIQTVSSIGVLTGITVAAFKILSSEKETFVVGGTSMIAFAAAIEVLALACKTLSSIGLEGLIQSVSSVLVVTGIMVSAFALLSKVKGELPTIAASMLLMSSSILVLAPVLSILGSMSWESIAKGLVSIAGAFTVLGVAGALLAPLTTTILSLCGSIALLGVGFLSVGAGLVLAGAGLSAVAVGITALVASVAGGAVSIVSGLTLIATGLISGFGDIIVTICQVIIDSAPKIAETIIALIESTVSVLVESAPTLVEGAFELITKVLPLLSQYIPEIVTQLVDFIGVIFDSLAENIPEIVVTVIDFIGKLFEGIIEAFSGLDSDFLTQAIATIGLISALMVVCAGLSTVAASAMVGLAEVAVFVAELGVILAAFGAINQIPGVSWLISEGGELLGGIGTAIGNFIGGIVGGVASGLSSNLPNIATNLSDFMTNLQPFIDGLSGISGDTLTAATALAEVVLVMTAADILDSLTSWFTGGNSLARFGEELAEFGPYLSEYYDSTKSISGNNLKAGADALATLIEAIGDIPNEGGVVSWFTGDNTLSDFGKQLEEFGPQFAAYGDSIKGLNNTKIQASADALTTLVDAFGDISNTGGAVSFFTGDNSVSTFGEQLEEFGNRFSAYGESIKGLNLTKIQASADALKAIVTAFEDADIGTVTSLSSGLSGLAESGIEDFTDSFTNGSSKILAAVETTMSSVTDTVENSKWSSQFYTCGTVLVEQLANGISDSTPIAVEKAEALAAAVAQTTNQTLGINSPSTVFYQIGNYICQGLQNGISAGSTGVNNAGSQLGQSLISSIQSVLGINSPSTVARDEIGRYVVQGIAEGITEDMTAEEAAEQKAQNIAAAFTNAFDKIDLGKTTADLEYELWENLYGDDATDAEKQAKQLELYDAELEAATQRVSYAQAQYLVTLEQMGEGSDEEREAYNNLLQEQIDLADLVGTINEYRDAMLSSYQDTYSSYLSCLTQYQSMLTEMGFSTEEIEAYAQRKSGYDPNAVLQNATLDAKQIISDAISNLEIVYAESSSEALALLMGSTATTALSTGVATGISSGITASSSDPTVATDEMVDSCLTAIENQSDKWYQGGVYLVQGFTQGIKSKAADAAAAAAAVAVQAYRAAMAAIGVASPSKAFAEIGMYADLGFVQGLQEYANSAADAAGDMATGALNGLANAISGIRNVINSDFEAMQPTIRPVLDLSNVESNTGRLNALFSRTQAMAVDIGMDEYAQSGSTFGNTYSFVQNNYSPKSLSRLEIYRQTKNQFSLLKEADTV